MTENNTPRARGIYKEEKMKLWLMEATAFAHIASFFCFLKFFDRTKMYFTKGFVSYILIGVWFILTAACVIYSLRADKSIGFKRQNDAFFSGVTCVAFAISGIIAGILNKDYIFLILALVSAVYFLPKQVRIPTTPRALCGIAAVVFLIYAIYVTYFDPNVPVNSPAKVIRLLGLATGALFIVYDIRAELGLISERAFNVVGSIALITLSFSMPTAIVLKDVKGSTPVTVLAYAALAYMLNFLLAKRKHEDETTIQTADTPENQENPDAQEEYCEVGESQEDQSTDENS